MTSAKDSLPPTFVQGFHDECKVRKMNYKKFGNTDMHVSELSLGTGGFSAFYGECSIEECKQTVLEAIKSGINYIDTGPWYGQGRSEEILGEALKDIPREAYYIAIKVGRYELDPKLMFDFSPKKTKESIKESLRRLKLDKVDVIQVHDIEFAPSLDIIVNETLPTVAEALLEGKTRFIGITGYPVSVLENCIKKSDVNIDSVLAYTRLSLLNKSLADYLPFFESKNIGIINAAVHCMGLLTNAGPQDWHPAHKEIKDACTEARNYCKERNIELGKLALYFALQQKGPHTCLIGMNTTELLKCNLDVYYNGITEEEKLAMDHIEKNVFSSLIRRDWEDTMEQQKTNFSATKK